MHIGFFWVDKTFLGQGQGKRLLTEMEIIAKRERCKVIHLETFSFEAPNFTRRADMKNLEK